MNKILLFISLALCLSQSHASRTKPLIPGGVLAEKDWMKISQERFESEQPSYKNRSTCLTEIGRKVLIEASTSSHNNGNGIAGRGNRIALEISGVLRSAEISLASIEVVKK
jgi:hypothetical protein